MKLREHITSPGLLLLINTKLTPLNSGSAQAAWGETAHRTHTEGPAGFNFHPIVHHCVEDKDSQSLCVQIRVPIFSSSALWAERGQTRKFNQIEKSDKPFSADWRRKLSGDVWTAETPHGLRRFSGNVHRNGPCAHLGAGFLLASWKPERLLPNVSLYPTSQCFKLTSFVQKKLKRAEGFGIGCSSWARISGCTHMCAHVPVSTYVVVSILIFVISQYSHWYLMYLSWLVVITAVKVLTLMSLWDMTLAGDNPVFLSGPTEVALPTVLQPQEHSWFLW